MNTGRSIRLMDRRTSPCELQSFKLEFTTPVSRLVFVKCSSFLPKLVQAQGCYELKQIPAALFQGYLPYTVHFETRTGKFQTQTTNLIFSCCLKKTNKQTNKQKQCNMYATYSALDINFSYH